MKLKQYGMPRTWQELSEMARRLLDRRADSTQLIKPRKPKAEVILGLRLFRTTSACPEQYKVITRSNKQVGYIRLRGGWLFASVPDCSEDIVFEINFADDRGFLEKDDRKIWLEKCVKAIKERMQVGRKR